LLLKSARGVRYVALPGWLQAIAVVACLGSVGGIAHLAMNNRAPGGGSVAVESSGDNPMRTEMMNIRRELSTSSQGAGESGDRLATTIADNEKLRADLTNATAHAKSLQDARDDMERRAKAAEQALTAKSSNASQLARSLDDSKSELRQSETQRATLQSRVQQLQAELQAANNRAAQLAAQLNGQPQQVASDPGRAQLAPAPQNAPAPSSEAVAPLDVVAPIPERKPDQGTPHAREGASELEKLLVATGLDIDRLLSGLGGGASSGQGGPYIALDDARADEFNQKRLDELKKLATTLPLSAPLSQFQLESGFGARVDPINHRPAFHPGLDLAAPYKSAIYNTAPGTVVFTGTRDSYGRMVEIDHGHGIFTRYAHLHRILVARGQRLDGRVEIGELGSTGRSTGPHVHYEVLVDGTPLDPAKFMEAGKNVVQINDK